MTTVKHFHSAMQGAPVLNGTAGSLITLLDACLVTGFGLQPATSVVVADGIATISVGSTHAFEPDSVILVSGATPAGLNGEKRVLTRTGTAATFAATGISNQTATGTIEVRLAPVGWGKTFSDVNRAVYRSADVTGTRMFLSVNDADTLTARVIGYESMTAVNSGTGLFPTSGQMSGGYFWDKSNAANATASRWTLVADARTFYLTTYADTTAPETNGITRVFGDFIPRRSGDPFACALSGSTNASNPSVPEASHAGSGNASGSVAVARSFNAIGSAVSCALAAASAHSTVASGNSQHSPAYPNAADNGLVLAQQLLYETPGAVLRGQSRGLLYIPQNTANAPFAHRFVIDGQGDLVGRRILVLRANGVRSGNAASAAAVAFDLTGPWG